jgi:type IV fimbrial biogenesis protein FimT
MKQSGFTLIELFVTLLVVGVVASIAVPAMAEIVTAQRRFDVAQQLASGIRTARHEAVVRNQLVVIRAIDGQWGKGWQIVVDPKGTDDDLILVDRARSGKVPVVGNGQITQSISFSGLGAAVGNGFVAGTLSICDADKPVSHHQVKLASAGRVRIESKTLPEERCG